jgi:hypothetical protein
MLNEKELLLMKCTEALKQHGATPTTTVPKK